MLTAVLFTYVVRNVLPFTFIPQCGSIVIVCLFILFRGKLYLKGKWKRWGKWLTNYSAVQLLYIQQFVVLFFYIQYSNHVCGKSLSSEEVNNRKSPSNTEGFYCKCCWEINLHILNCIGLQLRMKCCNHHHPRGKITL